MDMVNNLLAELLTPLKEADEALATCLQIAGKGVDWSGQALGEAGTVMENIEQKIGQLQDMLRAQTAE
jgi:hypothetical protein